MSRRFLTGSPEIEPKPLRRASHARIPSGLWEQEHLTGPMDIPLVLRRIRSRSMGQDC